MSAPSIVARAMPGSRGEHDLQELHGTRARAEAFYKKQVLSATMGGVSSLPPLGPCTLLLVTGLTLLGMGNGAVFQLVAQRFPGEMGVITGIVGDAGGLGGFVLPNVPGILRQSTRSYGGGFLAIAVVAVLGAVALSIVGRMWEGTFLGKGGVVVVLPSAGLVGTPGTSAGL
jgi:NNP family nitrate/nitrite transporter-like MFS transporter